MDQISNNDVLVIRFVVSILALILLGIFAKCLLWDMDRDLRKLWDMDRTVRKNA